MSKVMSVLIKSVSFTLVLVTVFCLITTTASATSWKTGCVPSNGNSGYTTVWLTNTSKKATIKIHSYTYLINPSNATQKSTSFHVTMRTVNNTWIWEGDITTGTKGVTLSLGNNYSAYKICIRQNAVPFGSWTLNYANYWGIECTSNCYI